MKGRYYLKKEFVKEYDATKATVLCLTDIVILNIVELDSEISNCIDEEIICKYVSEDSP